jgi:hypothetical protein
MRIEDRMSMLAAKKPRDEVSELLLEGAQEIADLRRQCQVLSQKNDCPDPDNAARQNILTDEERESLAGMASYFDTRGNLTMQAWGSLLRVLLKRMA